LNPSARLAYPRSIHPLLQLNRRNSCSTSKPSRIEPPRSNTSRGIVGDEIFILRAGDTLIAPRDIPHQLRNSGTVENHYLLVFSPSGFEEFLRVTAVPAPDHAVAPTEPPAAPVRNVHQLAADYGIRFG
jgi:hypothetical protein